MSAKAPSMTLKFISSLSVKFSPLQREAQSARAFVNLFNNTKNRTSNPKCDVKIIASESVERPSIEVVYNDKKKLVFDPRHMHGQEMVDDINKHSKTLQLQEEIKQAS